MNWKFKLAIVLGISLGAVIFLNLPASKAQTDINSAKSGDQTFVTQGKITQYPNGVSKVEPEAFGITGPVRDLPTSDPDALAKRATFVSAEQRRELKREQQLKEKGIYSEETEDKEINEQNAERIKTLIPGAGAGFDAFQDPLLKKARETNAPQAMPTPNLTFNGASQTDNAAQGIGAVLPPDVNGDVGPNHYVSSVNLVYKIFTKTGAVAAGPFATNLLFSGLPATDPCRTANDGDPVVVYDPLADRWHISQFAVPGNPDNFQCVALSVTGDPTGSYYVWRYTYPGQIFNDYPKVGVWSDAYHMTFNQFNNAGTAFLGMGILSQDRAKALAGDPTASVVYTNIANIDPNAGGGLPADIDGIQPPPSGMAEVIAEFRSDEAGDPLDAIRYYKWVPNFVTPASSTISVLPDVALAPFDSRAPATRLAIEQSTGAGLDAISDRLMHRFAYRNLGTQAAPVNSFTGNFTVNISGVNPTTAGTYQTGIRWFEMRRTGDSFSVFDQGTHSTGAIDGATGLNDWMGSVAQDNRGDIALGFSQASSTQRANIMIAGRTTNTTNSGVLNEGEAVFFASAGVQSSTSGRWGDYSAMNVDPVDDCTFWYTQEYYAANSSAGWSTRIGSFRFPQCTNVQKGTIQGTITFCAGGAPIANASVDATGGFNRLTGAPGTYSMTVAPGTYTVTANKTGGFNGSSQTVTVTDGGTSTANICLTGVAVVTSPQSPQVVSESCAIANGAPDPGEQLTVNLPLQNTGAASTINLTATLRATGGVQFPSSPQNYGALAPGSAAVTKNFSFTVDPTIACGSTITLTWDITDGATSYGTVTKTFTTGARAAALSENFDGVTAPALPAGWSNVQVSGTTINWVTSATTPSSAPNAAFANDPATVNSSALVSPAVLIQGTDAQISFKNLYVTESTYDGMVLEYTTNGGTTWTDVITGGGSFVSNGYNATISSSFSSPIAGRMAWSGNSGSYLSTVVNLPASLNGQTVRFRWLMASDSSVTATGVRVDDVVVLGARQCSASCSQTFESEVSPRPNGDGFVDSDDVQQIRLFSVGTGLPYQSNEFQRADGSPRSTSGDGFLDSDDVVQARRYSVGTDTKQTAAGQTAPGPIPPGTDTASGSVKTKVAVRTKDGAAAAPAAFRVDAQSTSAGATLLVPIRVDTVGNEAGYTFSIAFDSTKLTSPTVMIGNGGGDVIFNANNAGQIGFSVTSFSGGTIAAGNNIALVNVTFTVAAGATAGTTPITFTDTPARRKASGTDPNNPITQPTYAAGTITIGGATAAGATVSGRVSNGKGRGVANARVIITDSTGQVVQTARTNAFGYYSVADVASGESYIVSVESKQYKFGTRIITVAQDVDGIDFTAQP